MPRAAILVIEDEEKYRRTIGLHLSSLGDEVNGASTAEEGLKLAGEVDLVLSDLKLPGMNGIELMGVVRQLYPRSSRIMASGLSDQAEISRSLDSTHQFLAKPFALSALVAKVKETMAPS